ncbi:MAG: M15 family peptidase [Sphingobacteriales bacterium]|nr:MAG: M15 family peptidase [Sphingobacteriales bacterium]
MSNTPQDITPPVEFSGEGQLLLYTRYGDPRDSGFENKWITSWHVQNRFPWFPQENIMVHKHFKTILEQAFAELELNGVHAEIKEINETYSLRTVKGSSEVLSVHSWGAAIDMNATDNPLGSMGNWSQTFIDVMQRNEIHCGQLWLPRQDAMHFSMVNG